MLSRFALSITPETNVGARTAAPALYRAADLPGIEPRTKEIIRATANELLDLPATSLAPFHVAIEIEGDEEDPADLARHFGVAATFAARTGDAAALDVLRAAESASIALMERR
jgi:hypothetical protein